MKTFALTLGIVALLAGTLGAGWFHGQMSNRWGVQPDSDLAAHRLRQPLPDRVGHWRLKREVELEEAALRVLQCPAYISRVYEHEQTGDVISVAVLMGPPGPISVHTPEICYSANDYTLGGERERLDLEDKQGSQHSFWQVNMKSNGADGGKLRVLYGWTTGTQWLAAKHPRYGYGGVPHLYKLQLATASTGQSSDEFDASKDFLANFLVPLRHQLVESHTPPAAPGE
ncbi:MAG: exosortase-associated EpsI family protein [Pirellulaceae bacterium]